ncbi:MAG: cupredoxin domain-containing protein [Rubrobacter sp.]
MARVLIVAAVVLLGLGALFFALRPDSTASDEPRQRTLDVGIEGGKMDPGEVAVTEGDQVTLRVDSDEPVELHLHGYDIEQEVSPGETAELRFEADITGRFEIEDHGSESLLGVLLVRPR